MEGGEGGGKREKGRERGSVSSRDSDREESRRDVDYQRELSDSSQGGSKGDADRKLSVAAEASRDAPEESSPKARGTKWGLLSMPDLKSTLNASLVRATNLIAKQPEESTNDEGDVESEDGDSKDGSIGQVVTEGDNERESVIGDEADRQTIPKKSLLGKNLSHGMSGMLGARHGMLSLKESLQARLTGTSGKLRTEHESGQDEGAAEQQSEDDGARRESGASRAPVNYDNTSVLSYNSLEPDQDQDASAITLPTRQAVDPTVKNADLENIFSDADDSQSSQTDTQDRQPLSRESSRRGTLDVRQRKALSRESSRRGSLDEGGRRAERRESISRADSLSPLRSLLQDVTVDQDVSDSEDELQDNSEEEQQEEEEAEEGGEKTGHEHVVEHSPVGFGQTKWSPAAHGLSMPDVASSVKEAAARVKSSISSPKFSGSLKSFRWNRNKEDSLTNDSNPSPQPASADDSVDGVIPSTTPTGALETEQTETCDEEESSRSIDSSSRSIAAVILVTIFRASGLPEVVPKRKFGRTKKDVAQDHYVRLKLHNCEAITSTAKKEGQECTWGDGNEGEVVEILIPAKKLADADGLESLKLILEMRTKAIDAKEKDALLSSTEIPISDWLGKKATWADLEATKDSPGGRVKLSVALTEGGATSTLSRRGSQKDTMGGESTSATTEVAAEESHNIVSIPSMSSTNVDSDVHGAFQGLQQDPMGKHGGMEAIAEPDPEASSIDTPRASSEIGDGVGGRRESKADVEVSRRRSNSFTSYDSQNGSDREESGPHATPQCLDQLPEAADEAVAPEEGAGSETGATSSDDNGSKHDAGGALPPTIHVAEVDNNSGGVQSPSTDDNVNITVLVQQADSLAISVSKNAFGRPKKNATQDPYVVIRMCGSREATSVVAGGGSKCQWPGTSGEAVNLVVPSADLMAAGWGQAEAEGPHLTVELWNQESATRQGDIFIGSADVRLKDLLDDSGPTWVDLRRRRNSRGRVMIDVSCPALHRGVSDTGQKVEVTTKRTSVEEKLTDVTERPEDPRRTSSESLEGGGRGAKARANRPGDTEKNEKQDEVKIFGEQPKGHEPIRRSGEVASDGHDRPTQGEEKKRLSGADVGQGTVPDSSPASGVAPVDSTEKMAPPRKERQKKTPDEQEVAADDIEERPNVPTADVTDLHAAENNQSSRFFSEVENGKTVNEDNAGSVDPRVVSSADNVRPSPEIEERTIDRDFHGLSRRKVGGTATTLDLAGSAPISDPLVSTATEKESTKVGGLTTTVSPVREHSEQELIHLGSEDLSQSARLGHDECGGDVRAAEQDQTSSSKLLKASDQSHSDGASSGGIAGGDLQASTTATPHDENIISTKPRDINEDKAFLTQQKLAKKWRVAAPSHSPVNPVAQVQTEKRLVRAREIARRRRQMISGCEPVGHRGRINALRGAQATDSLAGTDSSAVVTPEQVRAVTIIQGAFRGRAARRRLRAHQRAAVKIQAVCRGYVSRREFTGLRARTRRANVEEKKARQRRSRMAATQKELNLLRRTPTRDLTRIFAIRAATMATRIQRCWRQYGGSGSVRGGGAGEVANGKYVRHSPSGAQSRSPTNGSEGQTITAPKIKSSCRSDRSPPSSMTLEALRLRVETRQRASDHRGEGGRLVPQGAFEAFGETKRDRTATGTIDATYESLMGWQEEVSRLTDVTSRSEPERVAAAKRRSHRLGNFRRLQDQLLHPPNLNSSDIVGGSGARQVGDTALDDSRGRCGGCTLIEDAGKEWSLAEEPTQRDRAQRAHVLAVAAANVEGNKPWATSLPADVGFGQVVDIRRVLPSWSTKSRGGQRAQADGSDGYPSEGGTGAGGHKFSRDEASLWWYTYACTGKGGEAGVPKRDHAFPELLERVKTNTKHKREHTEREEHKHRQAVARKRQNIVQKVIHRQQLANRPSPHYARHRATEAQRVAAVVVQACVRGFLDRKKVALLRAEMRVFGALQVLVNELRQPELDEASIADPAYSLAAIIAEHTRKTKDDLGCAVSESVVTRCAVRAPPAMLLRPCPRLI